MTDLTAQATKQDGASLEGMRQAYLTEHLVGQGWTREMAAAAAGAFVAGGPASVPGATRPALDNAQRGWRAIARVLHAPAPEFFVRVVKLPAEGQPANRWLLASEGRLNHLRIHAVRFKQMGDALSVAREVATENPGFAALPAPTR